MFYMSDVGSGADQRGVGQLLTAVARASMAKALASVTNLMYPLSRTNRR